jgi:cation diffusion facilitator family transporter
MNVRRVRSETPDSRRQQLYKKAVLIALGGNILLAVLKGLLAWISGSSAVFSDAANSVSDTFYSLLMGLGLYLSQRPADESHPQGHGRFEPFVSLFIAIGMGAAGTIAIWQSIERFLGKGVAIETGWPTVVLILAALVKLGMYRNVKKIGEEAYSPAIRASANDNLSDILTSMAALAGVWGSRYVNPVFDPAAGLLVGLWIFRATWKILAENFGYMAGRGASPELTEKIVRVASEVNGVLNVQRVVSDYVGPRLRVDMHVDVDASMSLRRAHSITEEIKDKVEELPEVDLVFVHLDPVEVE